MSSIIISDAWEEDLEQIEKIERESFDNPYPFSLLKAYLQLAEGLFLVARDGDRVVGYCIGIVQLKVRGHIISIASSSEVRRTGIGSLLLQELERRFHKLGCTYSYLEVNVNNEEAIRFYYNRSYRVVRTRRNYYGRNKHGFVMVKNFKGESGFE
ncbi:ribosomal protein S18-alanine N-acetyltransferase [Metallosphaera javensis (ex Sakai et al. 2022)]|uniref:ribosomal protein S18-alanine N-acetyltransferase n=1 Tax=Metallosphaera javensis (ex Sakai et al. 2022) TaxID=2775498 RepID=UPI00258B4B4C|nr:MAG: ribosomal-protein-alanine N-acetyltransferase RimI [Metallosphaera javensis (ex Sakai et al. 2022)]